jgi:hypothetical protein
VTTAPVVAVVVVAPAAVVAAWERGAGGLLVPGAGPLVSRQSALAALVRGRVRNSIVGGRPAGAPRIVLGPRPNATVTISVALPPPGSHHNVRRYPIAIVGGGYRGRLVSRATRIPGLVGIADIAPTVEALEAGRRPIVTSTSPPVDLRRLDARLAAAHDSRPAANTAVVVTLLLAAIVALLGRSPLAARIALLAGPAGLAAAIALAATGTSSGALLGVALGAAVPALAFAGGLLGGSPRRFAAVVGALLVAYALVLALHPATAALAALGPHPDGGVRFYGVTNQVETLLLAPVLAAVAVAPKAWKVPLALLALLTIGVGGTGADGGGLVVFTTAFLVLGLRAGAGRLNVPRLAGALAGALLVSVLAVGIESAAGGTSHLTRALREGPGSLIGELGHRLHISGASATSSWTNGLIVGGALVAFVVLARRGLSVAYLTAIAVSLVVNDSPVDVALYGALGGLALLPFNPRSTPRGEAPPGASALPLRAAWRARRSPTPTSPRAPTTS